jgi:hypothetical protein
MKMDIENFNKNRGIFSPVVDSEGVVTELDNGTVFGVWMMGNNYHNKVSYYGTYPPSYLRRMRMLFPDDGGRMLHLFSGMVEHGLWKNEYTCDINPDLGAGIVGDAEDLSTLTRLQYSLILADPPYNENHVKYGAEKVNKKQVVKECVKILAPGGYLIWLDTIVPMWAKADGWKWKGAIAVIQSTQHQVRVATILQKV